MRAPLRHGTFRSAFRAPGLGGARRLRRVSCSRVLFVAVPALLLLGVAVWGPPHRKAGGSPDTAGAEPQLQPQTEPHAEAQAAAAAEPQKAVVSEPQLPTEQKAQEATTQAHTQEGTAQPQAQEGTTQPQTQGGTTQAQTREGTSGLGEQGQGAVASEVQALVEEDRKRMRAHIEQEQQQARQEPTTARQEALQAPDTGWRALPWVPAVRKWLDSESAAVGVPWAPSDVVVCEEFFERGGGCGNNCHGRGVCNERRGVCHCHIGYKGHDCGELEDFPCNNKVEPNMPIGFWVHSMCAAECDRRSGRCLCGNSTPFPNRPAPFPCGLTKKPNGEVDWRIPETAPLYAKEGAKVGWCHATPEDIMGGRAAATCQCMYDGSEGLACELSVEQYCVNQCSERGTCVNAGFCQCDQGWYGIDCSIPTASQALKDIPAEEGAGKGEAALLGGAMLPAWLQGSSHGECRHAESEGDRPAMALQGHSTVLRAKLRRKPLVYIYDMPPEFTVQQLQARTWKGQCVRRLYGGGNETRYQFGQLYGAELAVLEGLLASKHRTLDAEAADYFFVPVFGQCIAERGPDDSPAMNMKHVQNVRVHYAAEVYREAQRYVASQFPYFNRSQGRDHMWFFGWDEGACTAPKDIWKGVMLSHWGNTMQPHTGSQSQYGHDVWNRTMGPDIRDPDQPCFDPAKDVVMPAWTTFTSLTSPSVQRPVGERKVLFYFTGNLGHMFSPGRPEPGYSMGIRQRVGELFSSTRNVNGSIGSKWEEGVVVSHMHSGSYGEELASAQFCGVFPGDGFSARMEAAMLHGCIPVIVQDGIQLTFENYLDFSKFAVRVAEADLPSLLDILKAIPMERRVEMQQHVLKLRLRWTYHSVDRLELQRQQRLGRPIVDPWQETLQRMDAKEDDAMDTLFQILALKRERETWRHG